MPNNRMEKVKKRRVSILRFSGAKQYCPRAVVCLKISTGKDKTGVSIYRGVLEQCFSSVDSFSTINWNHPQIQPSFYRRFFFFPSLLSVISVIIHIVTAHMYICKKKM